MGMDWNKEEEQMRIGADEEGQKMVRRWNK